MPEVCALSSIWFLFALIALTLARKEITIGAIFDEASDEAQIAFKYAVARENMYDDSLKLVSVIRTIQTSDSFAAENAGVACELLSVGVAAIFGPNAMKASGIVAAICNEAGIPHFTANWVLEMSPALRSLQNHTRNLFPSSDQFSRALADKISDDDWKTFTIIYEDAHSLMRLQDILQLRGSVDSQIVVRQMSEDGDYKSILKQMKVDGETRFILDCAAEKVMDVLKQASDVKMLDIYRSYFIASLDAHALDYSAFHNSGANITTFRLYNPDSVDAETAIHDWRQGEYRANGRYSMKPEMIKTETVLMHDAVRLFAMATREYITLKDLQTEEKECGKPSPWEHGEPLLKIISNSHFEGISGRVNFDESLDRQYFSMDVLELSLNDGVKRIATWDSVHGINTTRKAEETERKISESLQNYTLIVSSKREMPFLQLKPAIEGVVYEGNDRYEGYSIDLIDGIAKILGCKYKFVLDPKDSTGAYDEKTKKWNGIIGTLLEGKADVAICDLTINAKRRKFVDFTSPFMTLGISILHTVPKEEATSYWTFLKPLSTSVWVHMATAYLCVTVVLLFVSRMAADDWENPHPCEQDPDELETIWGMHNCIWLSLGSIMQQGCDILPKSASTRIALSMWFFFALIIISSYTANLAAFLTSSRLDSGINSATDLAKQTKVKYGVMANGSTETFFKESTFPLYQRMWSAIESAKPSVFVKSNKEGIERVEKSNGDYAFLMESTAIEYATHKNCNLTQIGGQLDSKGYGIAMPFNSPYRKLINKALLEMQEKGQLSLLKKKWYKDKNKNPNGIDCKTNTGVEGADTQKLGVENFVGVFLVLGVGCGLATLIGIIDFLWNIRSIAIEEKITPGEALRREFAFIVNLKLKTKPVGSGLTEDSSSEKSVASSKSSTLKQATKISGINDV